MYSAGDQVPKGKYQCTTCDEKIIVRTSDDLLPECPKCRAFLFKKLK